MFCSLQVKHQEILCRERPFDVLCFRKVVHKCRTPMSRPPKATVYKSHFSPLRHFCKRHHRDSLYHRSNNKLHLVQSQSLCHYCPMTWWQLRLKPRDLRTFVAFWMCFPLPIDCRRVDRSLSKRLAFHTLVTGSFLHAEQVCQTEEAIAS